MRLTHFDGQPLNVAGVGFKCAVSVRLDSYAASVRRRERASFTPARQDIRPRHRQIQVTCWPPDDNINIPFDDFRIAVYRMFDPMQGERELRAIWERDDPDDDVTMFVLCDVTDVRWDANMKRADVTLEATEPTWKSIDLTSDTSSPASVEGNAVTRPRITITDAGIEVGRSRVLVRDRTGRGVTAWPMAIGGENTTEVFVNGVSVPFTVAGLKTWTYLHIHPSRPTIVDVYTGGTPSPGAGKMDAGQLNLAASTNEIHKYINNWNVSANPGAASCQWKLANPIPFRDRSGMVTYGYIDHPDGAAFQLFSRQLGGNSRVFLPNDYTGIEFTSSVEISSIKGLRRTFSILYWNIVQGGELAEANSRGTLRVMSRRAEQEKWRHHYPGTIAGYEPMESVFDDDIVVGDAVQVAVALDIPNLNSTFVWRPSGPGGQMRLFEVPTFALSSVQISGSPEVEYVSSKVPEITNVGSTSARLIENAVLVNTRTGQRVTLERIYTDGPFVINADLLAIGSAVGVDYGRVRSSGGIQYFDLLPGDNPWTWSGGGTVELSWRERRGL